MPVGPIPITVLSGFLGAGKTTLLNHVLNRPHDLRVAVIVNDMGEVNVDAEVVRRKGAIGRTREALVELTTGCICCTLREDLLQEVARLVRMDRFDAILIESTGISDPVSVAETIAFLTEAEEAHLVPCHIDCLVTVVDAHSFWHDYASGETLLERRETKDEADDRLVVDLLVDQVEFCDRLILNKCDLVPDDMVRQIESVLRTLNPGAKLIRSVRGQVEIGDVLGTNAFDPERTARSAGWIRALDPLESEKASDSDSGSVQVTSGHSNSGLDGGGTSDPHDHADHVHDEEAYGLSTFVYRRARPFHPERLDMWIRDCWPEGIIRTKGFIWLATRNHLSILLSQAGVSVQIEDGGDWLADLEAEEREAILAEHPGLGASWDDTWGDRKTELVFIGSGHDEGEVREALDACLLTDGEMEEDWKQFPDPFPSVSPDLA